MQESAAAAPTQRKAWVTWLSISLLALALILMALALRPVLMWAVSSTWVAVPAYMVDVQVTPLQTPEERSRARRALFKKEVIYRYAMAGQTWTSTHWGWYSRLSVDVESGVPIFEGFRAAIGTNTVAWVNPRNPSQSVLHRHPVWVVDMFRLGCAGIALVLYLVVQLLTSASNEQSRVHAMAKLALKTASVTVLVFASMVVLNDQMSYRPSWQLAAGALAFSALWIWGPLQILKGLKRQQPIMKWRRWHAPLPDLAAPHTRLNQFEPPLSGALAPQGAVKRPHALLAAVLATVAGLAYNVYEPLITPSVPAGDVSHSSIQPPQGEMPRVHASL
jgi:hypothetical protein